MRQAYARPRPYFSVVVRPDEFYVPPLDRLHIIVFQFLALLSKKHGDNFDLLPQKSRWGILLVLTLIFVYVRNHPYR